MGTRKQFHKIGGITVIFFCIAILIVVFQNCNQKGFRVSSLPTENELSSTLQTQTPNPVIPDPIGEADKNLVFSDPIPLDADPFILYSWHLVNTGQTVFATSAGAPGADLNLQASWARGILGKNVKVMVSDDGVENTHVCRSNVVDAIWLSEADSK